MMDSKDESITLSFLISGTNNCLPSCYQKLRSYLNVHSSNVAGYFGLKLPKILTSKNTSCPFCFTPWTQNTVSFKLCPSLSNRKKKSFYDLNKTEESIYSRNKLILQCQLCTKKSLFLLIKKKNSGKQLEQLSTDNLKKKKKKRKDKDKHSGLKLQCDIKVKKHNGSGSKNGHESLKSSGPSQVTICGNAITQNLEQKKPAKNKTKISNSATENLKVTKKNVKSQLLINPNALLNQSKSKKKTFQKFKRLKKAINQEKITAKGTLKDFLTLVNK